VFQKLLRFSRFFIFQFVLFLCATVTATSMAAPRYFMLRSGAEQLPTGCQLGWGPQYQSFDGWMGRRIVIGSRDFFDFNPVHVCKAAANVCTSQMSGQSCCINACRQHNTGMGVRASAVVSIEGFQECTKKCPGAPTFKTKSARRQLGLLEAPLSVRYRSTPVTKNGK
jgi:hypothetical protein